MKLTTLELKQVIAEEIGLTTEGFEFYTADMALICEVPVDQAYRALKSLLYNKYRRKNGDALTRRLENEDIKGRNCIWYFKPH
jgi:hypothetical protein